MKVHGLRGNTVYHFEITITKDGVSRVRHLYPVASTLEEARRYIAVHIETQYTTKGLEATSRLLDWSTGNIIK